MKTICGLAIAAGVLASHAAVAQDAARFDSRWTPWLGCWRLVQEGLRDATSSPTESGTTSPSAPDPSAEGILVCVLPSLTDPGVEMTTFVGGRSVLTQTIFADSASHPVNDPDCRGRQTSEWSRDGERLFTRAELECSGQPKRAVSGVTLMAKGPTWVDIQAVLVNDDQQVRVRRYRRTVEMPTEVALSPDTIARAVIAAAQLANGTRIGTDDVIEASSKIPSQAVEAALVEASSRFDLNSRALVQLDTAGVSDTVIDLMIALSFPERFKVERAASGSAPANSSVGSAGTALWYGSFYPYQPYYQYQSYYPYYYSPFAYSNWWGNGYGYYGGPSSVIVIPGTPGAGPSGEGRAIQGRGYTRVRPNEAVEPPRTGQRSTTSTSGGDTPRTSSGSGSGSSSGGAVSGHGYSSGGSSSGSSSGSNSGPTAQPR